MQKAATLLRKINESGRVSGNEKDSFGKATPEIVETARKAFKTVSDQYETGSPQAGTISTWGQIILKNL